jgi:hypothetical protein
MNDAEIVNVYHACGEMVDDDFDLCWNCQNPRTPY